MGTEQKIAALEAKDEVGKILNLIDGAKSDLPATGSVLTLSTFGRMAGMDPFDKEGPNYSTLKKMRNDPEIALGLAIIQLPMISAGWEVKSKDPKVAACIDAWMRPLWPRFIKAVVRATTFGYQPFEKVWEWQDQHVTTTVDEQEIIAWHGRAFVYDKLKDIPPDTVTVLWEAEEFAGLEQTGGGGKVGPAKSFVSTNDIEFGNLYGRSVMLPSYDAWYRSQIIEQFLARYLERRGVPPVKVLYPKGSTAQMNADGTRGTVWEHQDVAMKVGSSLREHSVAAVPSTRDDKGNLVWDVDYMKDDQRAGQFIEALQRYDQKKIRGLVVPDLVATEGQAGRGSYAQADQKAEFFIQMEEARLQEFVMQINRWVVAPLVEYNFGAQAEDAEIITEGLSEEDTTLLRDIVKEIATSGRLPLDIAESMKRLGLPQEKTDDTPALPVGPTMEGAKTHSHGVTLEGPTRVEGPLKDLGQEWDKKEKDFVKKASPLLLMLIDDAKDAVREAFKAEAPLAAIGRIRLSADMAKKYRDALTEYISDMYEAGRKSMAAETKTPVVKKDADAMAYPEVSAAQIEEGDTNDLAYMVGKRARDAYLQNKGVKAALDEIDSQLETHIARSIVGMASAMGAEAINEGRKAQMEPFIEPTAETREWLDLNPGSRIEYLKWVAVNEPGTCELCSHLDGMIVPADSPEVGEFTPGEVHCNCKCVWQPITAEEAGDAAGAGRPIEETWKRPSKAMVAAAAQYDPRFYRAYTPAPARVKR